MLAIAKLLSAFLKQNDCFFIEDPKNDLRRNKLKKPQHAGNLMLLWKSN